MAEYVGDGRLHMGYSFELLTDDRSAGYIRGTVETLEARMPHGWPCWAISNHDVQRAVTRWGGSDPHPALAAQLVALVCSLRGSVCLYQGEELGLREADVPLEALQDPYGIAFWPNFKGRDGCRTPMPWDESVQAGFTTGTPWLPIPAHHRAHSVAVQARDPSSVLNRARAFLAWRRAHPALVTGSIRFLDAPEPVLAFVREDHGERLLVVFNLGREPVRWPLPGGLRASALDDHGQHAGAIEGGAVELPAHGVLYAALG
jgi:alpha-glucosidase